MSTERLSGFIDSFSTNEPYNAFKKIFPRPHMEAIEDSILYDYAQSLLSHSFHDPLKVEEKIQEEAVSVFFPEKTEDNTQRNFHKNINLFNMQFPQRELYIPRYSHCYEWKGGDLPTLQGVPVVFMEVYDLDWESILSPWKGRSLLFIFYHLDVLVHSLQFDAVLESLLDSKHHFYLFNEHIDFDLEGIETLCLVNFTQESYITANQEEILNCLLQGNGNAFYHFGKRVNLSVMAKSLSTKHFPILYTKYLLNLWHDTKQYFVSFKWKQPPRSTDLLEQYLSHLHPLPEKKQAYKHKKLRIAHVLGRLSDTQAVSKRLVGILEAYDEVRFSPYLFTSECQASFTEIYTQCTHSEALSKHIAPELLQRLDQKNIPINLAKVTDDYLKTAKIIAHFFQVLEIDVVVFHDVSVMNMMIARLSTRPKKLLMEHGHRPYVRGCFDGVVLCHAKEEKIGEQWIKRLNIASYHNANAAQLPFPSQPLKRELFGFSQESILFCTLSHCFHVRFSQEMKRAVIKILQHSSHAHYIFLGPCVIFNELWHEFNAEGLGDRVHHFGKIKDTLRYLEMMDIYLNEFPIGSGFALLEAMAVGCPIVSMYDEKGPIQARHGAYYFGFDRVIQSKKTEDYIDLACQLIDNKSLRKEWAEHAVCQYKKRSCMATYMEKHQNILEHIAENSHERYSNVLEI